MQNDKQEEDKETWRKLQLIGERNEKRTDNKKIEETCYSEVWEIKNRMKKEFMS